LGDIPLLMLNTDFSYYPSTGDPEVDRKMMDNWNRMQRELAALFTNGKLLIVSTLGISLRVMAFLDEIMDAISHVIHKVRAAQP
jgi:hypothetical protein